MRLFEIIFNFLKSEYKVDPDKPLPFVTTPPDDEPKGKSYYIEYYPESDRYYVRYGNKYLKRDYLTGIVETRDDMVYADKYHNREGAMRLVNMHKEQNNKALIVIEEIKD